MAVDLSRLKSLLLQTGLAQSNNVLFQFLNQILTAVSDLFALVNARITTIANNSGPVGADYLTWSNETPTLPNSRQLLAGDNVTFDDSVVGKRTINASATGDLDATYITELDETATLPNSRQILAGTNITLDDTVPNQLTINASGGGLSQQQVCVLVSLRA